MLIQLRRCLFLCDSSLPVLVIKDLTAGFFQQIRKAASRQGNGSNENRLRKFSPSYSRT